MSEDLYLLLVCHLVGDYVLQNDFIANTKRDNVYHLIVHCVLYCLPFYVALGWGPWLPILYSTHLVIDELKCQNAIGYAFDQMLHYSVIAGLYLGFM